ncbi:ABC transporter ATP-binding protein [Alphaproteobacteria bacterium]|nr:ABC transporter ATP-binding protein [Alphaproteobacteria bacterium]
MSDNLINATNLKKSFDKFIAVDNINLKVDRGEVVGFLGPNGAGKSTTMKMLTGFLEPDEGEIFINGINLKSNPLKAKEHIGYLPEGAPSYSDMIVSDFLSFIGKMRGLSNKILSNRLDEMADQINLKEMWNRPVETLSKGFKRRVGIAQALIHDPDILILDEPTDGLDPNQKHEMRNLIRKISKNKGIVISTHILEEVEAVCSRAIIIANGKLLANDTPENLENKFLNKNTLSIKVSNQINNVVSKDIKSSIKYEEIKIQKLDKSTFTILVSDNKKVPNLNTVLKQINKHKLNVTEASFQKINLEEIFRTITSSNNSK